jgi:hypothetical protein
MANEQYLYKLVTRIRQRSDQLNSDTFDDATELLPACHASLAQLYEIMVSTWRDWYTIPRPLSLIANQIAYSLPADLRALNDVFLMYNGGKSRIGLEQFEPWDLGRYTNALAGQYPTAYCVMRGLLYLVPGPSADAPNAVELSYIPQYKAPLLNYSPMDDVLPNGWDEWVICDVLQKMSVKTRLLNMDDVMNSKKEAFDRLTKAANQRTGVAKQMRDAYANNIGTFSVGGMVGGSAVWAVP